MILEIKGLWKKPPIVMFPNKGLLLAQYYRISLDTKIYIFRDYLKDIEVAKDIITPKFGEIYSVEKYFSTRR